ncbi:MAG: 4-(cytidine 5'-diphospho)-2-C-methyl-D-erythritol kinase [Eubacteriales bacterium]
MITIEEKAYAKLNLTLDILGKRDDGYHDLASVMHPISLCDELEITLGTGEPWQVTTDWEHIPHGRKNLAYKAAKLFFDKAQKDPDGMTITITKRIPDQGGLGGGSADAGAVLRGLNRHYDNLFTAKELEAMALELGSDVPFCIRNRTVMAKGRGEMLAGLHTMPEAYYVLVQPEFKVSTPELFQKVDDFPFPARPDQGEMILGLEEGNLIKISKNLLNVFEYVLLPDHPELEKIENALDNCGAMGTSMTGSGSVMFGVFHEFGYAAMASMALMKVGYKTFMATNLPVDE